MPPSCSHEGFWLPAHVRGRLLEGVEWETAWIGGGGLWSGEPTVGAESPREGPGVSVRWPRLTSGRWSDLLQGLQQRRTLPADELLARWELTFSEVADRLMAEAPAMLQALADCTGYSHEMLVTALTHGGLLDAADLAAATRYRPSWEATRRWDALPGLPGRVRFFPDAGAGRLRARVSALPGFAGARPLCRPAPPVDMVLGYAAGNVPGTGFLIALLAGLANAATPGAPAPAVVVRNSRHEPLFTPWVLRTVEAVDPELVAGIAVLVWDYDDSELQATLMRHAGLMLAAAGDDTIAALDAMRRRAAPSLRFHRHGHKASFAVIGTGGARADAARDDTSPDDSARLGALDSAFWDQNGCLSARVHFVCGDPEAYARALTTELRSLAGSLPRGSTPVRFNHRTFDAYVALSATEPVTVCSRYDDDFAVVIDRRRWTPATLQRVVNACTGRSVVVRPVAEPLEAARVLRGIPASNLQSVSLWIGDDEVEAFADAAGSAGVTAVRALGRAAFPRLAYSWDGFLPLDLGWTRPPGHFTTIEFDSLRRELDPPP